ncbi:hypothetical protein BGW39_002067, partial [Mortierella sp. 14UC]
LDLTLDWNTSFEDLRILKGVMQQSNVFHLGLNLCGKTGPTSDIIYRNRRAEPIVQMMASGKIHTMNLKNTTGFLSQTKELLKMTLHVRHFDLSERISNIDDFAKLEKLVRASPMLIRLGVAVGDMDGAFGRLKPFAARHKALSILDLQLQDGTAASIQFEQGSDKIVAIGLKIVELSAIELMQMSMVTSVAFLTKSSLFRCSGFVKSAIEKYAQLKVIEVVQLPDGAIEKLWDLKHAIDYYGPERQTREALDDSGFFTEKQVTTVAVAGTEDPELGFDYSVLDSIHKQSLLWEMVLLVVSADITETAAEEVKAEAVVAPAIEDCKSRSVILALKAGRALAMVRFELGESGSNSAILHVDDFNAVEAFQHASPTTLTVIGGAGLERFKELTKNATVDFSKLRTLEIGCATQSLLSTLQFFQQATTHQYPALTQLNLWDTIRTNMKVFTLPLRDLDLLDHHISVQDLPSLQNLFRTASTLSRLKISVSSLYGVFDTVIFVARFHKQLSKVLLVMGKSRLSAQFTVGSGAVESIMLRIRENELDQLLKHPKVTELDLGLVTELPRIQEIATSVFNHFRYLEIFKMDYRYGHLLEVVSILNQAAGESSAGCQLVLGEVDVDFPRRKERVLTLPLESLDIASHEIDEEGVEVMERLVRASPKLQELVLSVTSVDVAQRIFDCIVREGRPMSTLSMTLDDDMTAVFSLEAGSEEEGEDDALTVVQIVTRPELDETLFLPQAKLGRIDVVCAEIDQHQAAEIANFVLRHCCGVEDIRFMDLDEVQDVAVVIKDSIRRGLFLQDVERRNGLTSGTDDQKLIEAANKGAELAVYSAHSDNSQDDPLPWGIEEISIASSIVRARQDGTVEAIEMDSTDPDGVTLQISSVTFDNSDFVQLSDVTRLTIVVRYGSALIDHLISTAIFAFMDLEQLEISCLLSLDMNALVAAFFSASDHPSLKQIQIWCPDQSYSRIKFDLPIKILDLSWYPIPPTEHHLLQRIPAVNPRLTELTVKVPALLPAFEAVCSIAGNLGCLEQMHLHGEVGSILSIRFNPAKGGMVLVIFSSMEFQDSMLKWDVPVLRIMEYTDGTLDVIGAIQAATVSNPELQSLVLKNRMNGPRLTLEIPFKKIDLGKQASHLKQLKSLKRFLMVCPQLTELHLSIDSVADLHEACTAFGPVFQKYQKLTDVRLKLQNGTEVSVRYSNKDGSVSSIALRTSDEFVEYLRSLPMVKKITIRPKDTSLWRDATHTNKELTKILRSYLDLETLEFDCGVTSPFTALFFLQGIVTKLVQVLDSPRLRRYRHRAYDSNTTLITHDLPLARLDLGDFIVSVGEFPSLTALFFISPQLVDLGMSFPTSEMIDPVYRKLSEEMTAFGRLTSLRLKSRDGYGMSCQWRGSSFQKEVQFLLHRSPNNIETAELEVSGTEWPLCFVRPNTTKLTILPKTSDGVSAVTDNSNSVRTILTMARRKCRNVKHVVLTCPVYRFYELSSATLSLFNTERIDLHDPNDVTKIILTGHFGPSFPVPMGLGSLITVHLENISDEVYMDTFGALFASYYLAIEIVDWSLAAAEEKKDEEGLGLKVTMKRLSGEADQKFGSIVWETSNVSTRRVFELVDKMSCSKRLVGGGGDYLDVATPSFRVLWRTAHKDRLTKPPFWQPHPRPDKLLKDPEVAKLVARILVRKATEINVEYETLMALIPFLKTEIKRGQGGFGGRAIGAGEGYDHKPFEKLERYDVEVVESRPRSGDLEVFAGLISRTVEFQVHELVVEKEDTIVA